MYSEYALIYMNMSNCAQKLCVAFRICLSMAEAECSKYARALNIP